MQSLNLITFYLKIIRLQSKNHKSGFLDHCLLSPLQGDKQGEALFVPLFFYFLAVSQYFDDVACKRLSAILALDEGLLTCKKSSGDKCFVVTLHWFTIKNSMMDNA
jgi:hypothetical protein